MFITKKHLPRRAVLKAAGVSLALPFLDAMVPAGTALAQTAAVPRLRTGFFYIPHGAIMGNTSHGPSLDKWTPSGSGATFKLSPILASLEPYKKYVSSFGNLQNAATAGSVHSFTPATWLSATRPDTGAPRAHMATTLDQVIAKIIGQETPLPSLEVAAETTVQSAAGGGGYYSTLSFRDAESPLPMEPNPRKVFLQLFGEGDTPQERATINTRTSSLLDLILEGTKSLKGNLGNGDRAALDGYLESVREVERRTQKAGAKDLSALTIPEAPVGEQDAFAEQVKLMFDLVALAYQADLTRVASYIMAAEGTNRTVQPHRYSGFLPSRLTPRQRSDENRKAGQDPDVAPRAVCGLRQEDGGDARRSGIAARSLDLHVRIEHEQQRPTRQLPGAEHRGWRRQRQDEARWPAYRAAGAHADRESPPDAASEGRCRTRRVRRQHGHDRGGLRVMAVSLNRRDVLKGALGVFATWTSSRVLSAQQAFGGVRRLTDQMTVVDGGGSNVLAFFTGEGFVLVDGGAPKSFEKVMASLDANAKVNTLFNTHHHVDQTGNNEMFSAGTKIVAHKRTLEWMSADHWIQADDRYEKARPKVARPTETFLASGSLNTGRRADRLRVPASGPYERRYLCPLQECKRSGGGRRGIAAARSRARLPDRSVDRRARGCDGCPPDARE